MVDGAEDSRLAGATTGTRSRRAFLRGAFGASGVVLLAACQAAAPAAAPTAPPPAATAAAAAASTVAAVAPTVAGAAKPAATVVAQVAPTVMAAAAGAVNPISGIMAEDSAGWKAVLDGARSEGALTVYGSRHPIIEKLAPTFPDQYGFKVDYVSLGGGDTMSRTQTEHDAGRRLASVAMTGDTAIYALSQNGVFDALPGVPNLAHVHPNEFEIIRESNNTYVPYAGVVNGLLYNTDLVPPDQVPKTWAELVEPKWKGKLVMPDPWAGNALVWISANVPSLGKDWNRKLAQQDLMIVADAAARDAAIVRGERAIALRADPRGLYSNPGAHIQWAMPEEGVYRIPFVAAVIKDAPAPNAARVFMNWLLSVDFQAQAAKAQLDVPTVLGVTGHPLNLTAENLKLLGAGRLPPPKLGESNQVGTELYPR